MLLDFFLVQGCIWVKECVLLGNSGSTLAFTAFLQSLPCCLYGNNHSVCTFDTSRCSISLGCCNEVPRLGSSDSRRYFSEFWRLVFREAPPWLADGRLLHVLGQPSICVGWKLEVIYVIHPLLFRQFFSHLKLLWLSFCKDPL